MNVPPLRSLSRYAFTLALLLAVTLISRSQTGCPSQSSKSAGWAKDTGVYFNVTSLPPAIRTQALAALSAWTNANGANNSGVSFVPADANNPATLTFRVGVPEEGGPAGTAIKNIDGTSTAENAEIVIDANNTNYFRSNVAGFNQAIFKAFLHEIGHTMGLADVPVPNPTAPAERCGDQTARQSVMNALCAVNDSGGNMATSITPCDQSAVFQSSQYYRTPCPSTECNDGSGFQMDTCSYPGLGGCPPGYHSAGGCCQPDVPSPILIDVDGSGFQLTSAANGVWFDFYGTGQPIKLAWTRAGSTNAWLVFDRNFNDTVDSALELFGNYTSQPFSSEKNGFLALAEFDKRGAGGNEDGQITAQDAIFNSLRLWIDTNHNGISEAQELHKLAEYKLKSLSLDYREAKRTDAHGNQFRYRAKVKDSRDAQLRRWAWDVFLMTQ